METLHTQRLILSAPTLEDVPAITAACQDAEIQRWTTIPSPYERSDAEGFIEIVNNGWETALSPNWALRLDGSLIGTVGLVDEGARGAELGFWLAPEARGRGFMEEAVAAACDYGFETMGLVRLTWRALVGNLGSTQVARRAGFRYEGLMRLGLVHRGIRADAWVAGRLASDAPIILDDVEATWPAETFR